MIRDKYSAVWVSHSSITDYLKCPRAYYLKNIYRDPRTNRKISLMQPPLALGQAVHATLDTISDLPVESRFVTPLTDVFDRMWMSVSGERGGFRNRDEELRYQERGLSMIRRVIEHPGPLLLKAVKIRQELPYYWISEEDNIILCGKIDWLEYVPDQDGVKILDFKTGKYDEDPQSLQLPIYYLIVSNTQNRKVIGVNYWYLERDDMPVSVALPDADNARETVLEISKRIALARKLERFICPRKSGCPACLPLDSILAGKAKLVGTDMYNQDVYILN